jgi:hypothetical protein
VLLLWRAQKVPRALAATAFKKWMLHTTQVRSEMNIPRHYKPWSASRPELQAHPNLGERAIDVIDVAWADRLQQQSRRKVGSTTEAALAMGYFANVSQAVQRHPFFHRGAGTLCKSSLLYSFEGQFVLTGGDHLAALGFPNRVAYGSTLEDSEKRNMAGEAFALPCAASVLCGIFLNSHATWWRSED